MLVRKSPSVAREWSTIYLFEICVNSIEAVTTVRRNWGRDIIASTCFIAWMRRQSDISRWQRVRVDSCESSELCRGIFCTKINFINLNGVFNYAKNFLFGFFFLSCLRTVIVGCVLYGVRRSVRCIVVIKSRIKAIRQRWRCHRAEHRRQRCLC